MPDSGRVLEGPAELQDAREPVVGNDSTSEPGTAEPLDNMPVPSLTEPGDTNLLQRFQLVLLQRAGLDYHVVVDGPDQPNIFAAVR